MSNQGGVLLVVDGGVGEDTQLVLLRAQLQANGKAAPARITVYDVIHGRNTD